MDFELYGAVIAEIEDIITGVMDKMNSITYEEWKEMKGSWSFVDDDIEEKRIHNNMFAYRESLRMDVNYQLLFSNFKDAEVKIPKVVEYIKKQELDLGTLELVCYASFCMIFKSARKMRGEDIERIGELLRENIKAINKNTSFNQYLEIMYTLVFTSMAYAYNSINNSDNWKYEDETAYINEIDSLIAEAKGTYPNGEIIELISEIFLVEQFFKEPTDERIEVLNKECFSKENNWMWHISTRASLEKWEVDQPWMHYLPHVKFCTSSDSSELIIEQILESKPKAKKGYWGIPTPEQLKKDDEELQEEIELWETEAYSRIFMQPYEIHTNQSKGQIFYFLLAALADNKELEENKNNMVADFAHSYGNYEIDNVYNIAKALNENPTKEELEDYGRELLLEYLNKQMISKEIKMLRLEHKDSFDELTKAIINSVSESDDGINVNEIVDEALKRVVLRILLEENNNRIEDIRLKYEKVGIDTYNLLDRFEIDVIRNGKNCSEWVNRFMSELNVQISDKWNNIILKRNSEGNVFIMSLLMELLFNMYTYSDINNSMNLIFGYESTEDENYLVITTKNAVDDSVMSNTKRGLDSRNRILSKINYGNEYRWRRSILKDYINENKDCIVKARIKSSVLGVE